MNEERAVRDRARRDSVERADTSATARAARDRRLRDSVNRAAAIADSIARDTKQHIPPPALSRPPLISELAIVLATPLETETPYRLALRVVGMLGTERIVQSIFTRPAPAPAVPPDTTALRPPPAPPRSP